MDKNTRLSIIAITIGRLVINITKRFAYAFVRPIALSFGVDNTSIQNLISLQNGVGLFSPIFGTISERYGRKTVMLVMLLMMTGTSALLTIAPIYGIFAFAMLIFGFGKVIYDPTFQAYVGDMIPFSQRARVIGFTELSWAGSLLIAAPIVGFLLDSSTLQVVFGFITICLFIGTIAIWLFVTPIEDEKSKSMRVLNPIVAWNTIRNHRPAVYSLIFTFALFVSNEIFFINYGIWMEQTFKLSLTALGTVTTVIAIAEVMGEFVVISIADRFGARRTALTGAVVATICYVIIPYLSFSLPAALAGIFFMFLGVETAIVSSISIFTEILPNARAVILSGNVGAASSGRLLGGALGGFLYRATGSFPLVGLIATIISFVAVVMMWRFIPE